MAEDRLTEHVLRYTTDEASIADSVRATERIKAGLVDVSQAARAASQPLADLSKVPASGAQQNVDALFDRLDDLEGVARAARQALGDAFDEAADGARRATDRVGDLARAERERAERARLYGDVESRTRAVTGAVGYIGGAAGEGFERTANIGAEVLAATEGIGLLRMELPRLVSQLGLTTSSIVGLSLAAGGLAVAGYGVIKMLENERKERERVRQAIDEDIKARLEVSKVVATSTTEEVEAVIAAREQERAGLQDHLHELEFMMQGYEDLVSGVSSDAADAFLTLDEASTRPFIALERLQAGMRDTEQAIGDIDGEIEDYNTRLAEGATAAADAARAEEDLRLRRLENAQQVAAEIVREEAETAQQRIDLARRERDWSSEQVEARLEDIDTEIQARQAQQAALQRQHDMGVLVGEAWTNASQDINDTLFDLQKEARDLALVVLPAARAREAEAEALDAANKAQEKRLDLMREEAEEMLARRDTFASFLTETRVAQEEHAQILLEEEQDFQRERLRDWAAHYRDLADLDADAARKEADALDKLAEQESEGRAEELKTLADHQRDRQRAAEDHQRRLRQIEDDAQFDFEEAARKRDTAGALAALRRGERALKGEDEQYRVAQQRREEDFNEQLAELRAERAAKRQAGLEALADLREQHARERAERIAEFQRRLQEEDQDRHIRLQRQQEAWQAEDEARRKHYAEQLGLTQKELQKIYHTSRTYLDGTSSAFSNAVRIMAGEANALLDAAQRASGFSMGQITYSGTKVKPPSKQKKPLGFADGGLPPVGEVVKVGERGPELAMFTDPVRVYSRQSAAPVQPASVTVNLGGLGGITVARTPGQSVREMAEAAGDGMRALVVDVLEDIIGEYAGDAA